MYNRAGHNLTSKQKKFIKEYLVDLNASKAAIKAGYSVKSAWNTACKLLQNPYIQIGIAKWQKEISNHNYNPEEKLNKKLEKSYN